MTENVESKDIVIDRINPLLEKLKKQMPGETFRLPSRGLFYTNGEVDSEVEDGEIVIYPMTTVDELMMRSPDMLFQGTAITEVISHCVPQILKPGRLIASDIDFILTCLRKVSYGPTLPIKHKCSACESPEKEFSVPIDHFLRNSKEITAEQFESMNVVVDEYNVKLRPCVFEEMIKILQRSNEDFDTAIKVSDWIDSSLSAIIRSVDGIKDRDMIFEWLKKMPRGLKDDLSNSVEKINQWGVEFSYEIKCEACGHDDNVKSSLNPTSFFTLPSSPKTP
jgi:hypothetical protein